MVLEVNDQSIHSRLTSAVSPTGSPVLEKMHEKRKIEKLDTDGPLAYIARAVCLVAAAIFFILMGASHLVNELKEKITISFNLKPILSCIRSMKSKEETDKLQTMINVLSGLKIDSSDPKVAAEKLTHHLETLLRSTEGRGAIVQEKIIRNVLKDIARQGPISPEWFEVVKDPQVTQLFRFSGEVDPLKYLDAIKQFLAVIKAKHPDLEQDFAKIDWNHIRDSIQKHALPIETVTEEVAEFKQSIKSLLRILQDGKKTDDPGKLNQQFIEKLRQALKSPVYQELKEDSAEPCIHLLQRLASDMWNKAPSVDAYASVGDRIGKELKLDMSQKITGAELADKLDASHKKMEKLHWSDHGISGFFYKITHPLQLMGALASEGGFARQIPAMVGLDQYDSHGTLSNNPSLQGVTEIRLPAQGDREPTVGQVNNCYGGSPTIGDHIISPEFEAAIQAAENNQLAPEQSRDPEIPMMVIYNNLQNLDKKHGEGPRSRTIMLLNKKHPFAFRGTTLAKDSKLYIMPEQKDVIWKNPEQFGQHLLGEFKRSFDPNEKGHGFYFHGSYAQWENIFNKVIENANAHFNDQLAKGSALDQRQLQGAYQEYVYSLLRVVNEIEVLNMLRERGISTPKVMEIEACKENIDRGGMANTKDMYIRLPKEHQERLSLILGVMHSRALSARDRVILHSRMPQILDFMRITEPEDFRSNLQKVFKELKYEAEFSEYSPAVSPKAVPPQPIDNPPRPTPQGV